MNRKNAKSTIRKEHLKVNWFSRLSVDPYDTVILRVDGHYEVFGTDERASVFGLVYKFDNEEEALDDLIDKARFSKQMLNDL